MAVARDDAASLRQPRLTEMLADALERESRAEARDTAARQRDQQAEDATVTRPSDASLARRMAASDRWQAGEDRDAAAGDLHDMIEEERINQTRTAALAAADRGAAEDDRFKAALDRAAAAHEPDRVVRY